MAEQKRYYWLKLDKDFFRSKRIKKLRRLAGGDTFTIIYLKMQLLSLTTDGCLEYTGLESSFEEELALDIDEDIENVKITVAYLLKCGLLIENETCEYTLPFVQDSIGSETSVAERVRKYRANQRTLQCNTSETQVKQIGNVEIDKDIDIDKEKEKNTLVDSAKSTCEKEEKYCEVECFTTKKSSNRN
jgi:predicted phage replisome organizer